jgi:DNA (cytosine-5)-methyltransferase 1
MIASYYEFFAGGGMTRAGLGAGWTCLLANEINPRKAAAYADNWAPERLRVCDVARLTPADLPGRADLAWASPPCQDVSLAGARAGINGERSGAFWSFMRLMRGLAREGRAPRLIVVENVTGLLTSNHGADFASVRAALLEIDYHVAHGVIDAAAFLPQSRPRVFIVGSQAPLPWRDLPTPRRCPRRASLASLIDRDAPCDPPEATGRLFELMAPLHHLKLMRAQAAGVPVVGTAFRRMRNGVQRAEVRFDGLAGALRMASGGGSSRQQVVLVDGASIRSRLLKPRECARLMGLPDSYRLPKNVGDALDLVGDGVAVPVVRFLAANALEPILEANVTEPLATMNAIALEGARQ